MVTDVVWATADTKVPGIAQSIASMMMALIPYLRREKELPLARRDVRQPLELLFGTQGYRHVVPAPA